MKKSVLPDKRDASTQVTAPSSNKSTGMRSNRESPPSIPRWVKVLAITALALFLLFVILRFSMMSSLHSAGGHTGFGSQTLPASIIIYGGQQL